MMSQCRFNGYNKCIIVIQHIVSGQFPFICCEPKTALKKGCLKKVLHEVATGNVAMLLPHPHPGH